MRSSVKHSGIGYSFTEVNRLASTSFRSVYSGLPRRATGSGAALQRVTITGVSQKN
jgi:hypothetical protein